jgi:CII-binding regulator of phage lambda lysogenization HflD
MTDIVRPNQKIKALSEDDVAKEIKDINKMESKFTTEIFTSFSKGINSVLSVAMKQCTDESEIVEIEQLRRVLSLCPLEEKFIRTKDKIWAVRKHIINKNADYFLKKDYSKIIKRDSNQAFIESLMEIVKDKFSGMDIESQNIYWKKAAYLLNCVARFKKAQVECSSK